MITSLVTVNADVFIITDFCKGSLPDDASEVYDQLVSLSFLSLLFCPPHAPL